MNTSLSFSTRVTSSLLDTQSQARLCIGMSLDQVLDLRVHRDMDKLIQVSHDVYDETHHVGLWETLQRAELCYAQWGDETDYDDLIRYCIDALAF